MIKDRHIGKFSVSIKIINDSSHNITTLMKNMIIIEAEYDPVNDKIDYMSINSKLFRLLDTSEKVPFYTITIDGNKVSVEEVK